MGSTSTASRPEICQPINPLKLKRWWNSIEQSKWEGQTVRTIYVIDNIECCRQAGFDEFKILSVPFQVQDLWNNNYYKQQNASY